MKRTAPRPTGQGDKQSSRGRWKSIQDKCHPAIFELAQFWKESIEALNRAGPVLSKEALDEIRAKAEKRRKEIHNQYPDLALFDSEEFAAQSIFSESALTSSSTGEAVAEWIHFERHKVPLKQDSEQMEKRDWDASRRVQRTLADIEQIRCGKGPIRPFQGNLEHSNIFETMWGLGLEKLTQEELADFFDKYCPCGIEAHDSDALKKHRSRFQQSLRDVVSAKEREKP